MICNTTNSTPYIVIFRYVVQTPLSTNLLFCLEWAIRLSRNTCDNPNNSHSLGTFCESETFQFTNITRTAAHLRLVSQYTSLQQKANLRCSSYEYLGPTCIGYQTNTEGKRSRESTNHAKFGSNISY